MLPRLLTRLANDDATAVSQIIEQLLRVVVMLGAAYMLLPYGLGAAAGGASMGPVSVRLVP